MLSCAVFLWIRYLFVWFPHIFLESRSENFEIDVWFLWIPQMCVESTRSFLDSTRFGVDSTEMVPWKLQKLRGFHKRFLWIPQTMVKYYSVESTKIKSSSLRFCGFHKYTRINIILWNPENEHNSVFCTSYAW